MLYARVSTQEQDKGQYPSCESQIEEMEAFCLDKGWHIAERIQDGGHRAGTLQRPGLSHLRHLVTSGQVEGVICTWYNRLIGSRDFYVLDKEFKAHNVEFVTVHDPADRNTASGRLLESMLVTIKTFENEQIAEKVQTKMRQRAEKGLWNGGPTPFAFTRDYEHKTIVPNMEQGKIIEQMFRVYVENRSDFAVRDWLKAHCIPTASGKSVWPVATIRKMLTNRIYIGEIEINRQNKGVIEATGFDTYRVAKARFDPLIAGELFELAQNIRKEKALESPHRVGKPRHYGHNRCGRVYPLQGTLLCGVCGHSMAPHYTYHKFVPKRRKETYHHYYVCAAQIKASQECAHKNRVSAPLAESWMMDTVQELIESKGVLEHCFEHAWENYHQQSKPQQDALAINRAALLENQTQTDHMIETIGSGKVTDALFVLLNKKANELKVAREALLIEQQQIMEGLATLDSGIDATVFRDQLIDFAEVIEEARPEEMQRLIRLLVKKIEWMPESAEEGAHNIQFYACPKTKSGLSRKNLGLQPASEGFATDVYNSSP